jgi:hypothetical protein
MPPVCVCVVPPYRRKERRDGREREREIGGLTASLCACLSSVCQRESVGQVGPAISAQFRVQWAALAHGAVFFNAGQQRARARAREG